jgi:hypothetical protein
MVRSGCTGKYQVQNLQYHRKSWARDRGRQGSTSAGMIKRQASEKLSTSIDLLLVTHAHTHTHIHTYFTHQLHFLEDISDGVHEAARTLFFFLSCLLFSFLSSVLATIYLVVSTRLETITVIDAKYIVAEIIFTILSKYQSRSWNTGHVIIPPPLPLFQGAG